MAHLQPVPSTTHLHNDSGPPKARSGQLVPVSVPWQAAYSIDTVHLQLRSVELRDAAAVAEVIDGSSHRLARFFGATQELDRRDVMRVMRQGRVDFDSDANYLYCVVDRARNLLLGCFRLTPAVSASWWLAGWLDQESMGNGRGREAAAALVRFALLSGAAEVRIAVRAGQEPKLAGELGFVAQPGSNGVLVRSAEASSPGRTPLRAFDAFGQLIRFEEKESVEPVSRPVLVAEGS